MPVITAFFLYLLGCMLLSSALLPWLHPVFAALFDASPGRALYRFAMLLALIGMPFFLRSMKLRGREAMGFRPMSEHWRRVVGKGLGYGILILLGLWLILMVSGARSFSPGEEITLLVLLKYALAGLASGLAVGLIEEFFFRGPMQTGARRSLGFWPTAILIGAFYAMVHFMRPVAPSGEEITIAEAFSMMWGGFEQLGHVSEIADRFIALLVAGVFLSMVRERTGSVLWAIGIHAGWVMAIKIGKKLTDSDPYAAASWLISNDGITGWGSTLWMGAIAAVYWWWTDPGRRRA